MRILVLGDLGSYHMHLFSETLVKLGHEVLVASLEKPIYKKTPYRKILFKTPIKKKSFIRYATVIPIFLKLFNDLAPTLVYAHFISNYGMIGKFFRGKKILSVWGSDLLVVPRKSNLHKWVTERILKSYDLIHVDARFVLHKLSSEYGIELEKIVVFPFGPSRDFLSFSNVEKIRGTFITHRRMDPDMDPETVVKAFAILRDRGFEKGLGLFMVSSGSLIGRIRKLINDLKLEGMVTLTGRVHRKRLLELLSKSEFYISASISDTTSVSLLEAMAARCFPIVSDIPGNKEWIEDGKNGLLFKVGSPHDLAEKILKAINNRELVAKGVALNQTIIKSLGSIEENIEMMLSKL